MPPFIGVTSAWSFETYPTSNSDESYIYAGKPYSDVVFKGGGIPVMLLPPFEEDAFARVIHLLDRIDGLLLTGGGSGFARRKNPYSPPPRELSKQQPKRYAFEAILIKEAWKRDMPVLGICRGHQMIAEVLGGTIKEEFIEGHRTDSDTAKESMNHDVSLAPDSKLSATCGSLDWCVNSFHIQVVEKIPSGFRVAARSQDGFIEAIEAIDKEFFVGVQFHPEEFYSESQEAQRLIGAFMDAAKKYGKKQRSVSESRMQEQD
jgi:putative glutamine amidotransferase